MRRNKESICTFLVFGETCSLSRPRDGLTRMSRFLAADTPPLGQITGLFSVFREIVQARPERSTDLSTRSALHSKYAACISSRRATGSLAISIFSADLEIDELAFSSDALESGQSRVDCRLASKLRMHFGSISLPIFKLIAAGSLRLQFAEFGLPVGAASLLALFQCSLIWRCCWGLDWIQTDVAFR